MASLHRALEDFLYYSEFDYILPAFDGEEAELMESFIDKMKEMEKERR